MYNAAPKMVVECRPYGIHFAQEIGAIGNKMGKDIGGQYAGMIASLTLQTIIVSLTIGLHPPGSKEGEEIIANFYDSAKRDAIDRWHEQDLKEFVKRGKL